MGCSCHGSGPSSFMPEEVPPYEETFYTASEKQPGGKPGPENQGKGYTYIGARPANPRCRPKNVVLFGETGVGKSSVVNLLAGRDVANFSSGLQGCTLEASEHSFIFPGPMVLCIFDTVGLEESEMDIKAFFSAITKAHQLIKSLQSTGGVDLLLFCIRAGRVTAAMQRNYRLFSEVLCGGQVPIAIVVTNLEQEKAMEKWWIDNSPKLEGYHIRSIAHACITALPDHVQAFAHKRSESRTALRTMLLNVLGDADGPYAKERQSWLITVVDQLRSFLTKKGSKSLKKDLSRKLEARCMLPRGDAERLAELLIDHPK